MSRIWWGITLMVIGFWIWAPGLDLPEYLRFRNSWPVLLVVLGVYMVVHALQRQARRNARRVDVISELEKGKIDVDEAVDRLKERKG